MSSIKKKVVEFYRIFAEFVEKDTFDHELATVLSKIKLTCRDRISIITYATDEDSAIRGLRQIHRFSRPMCHGILSYMKIAFRDLSPWIADDINVQRTFRSVGGDSHQDDLFLMTRTRHEKNGILVATLIASPSSAFPDLIKGVKQYGDPNRPYGLKPVHMVEEMSPEPPSSTH